MMYKFTTKEYLDSLSLCELLMLHNQYRKGNLDYIREYCKENGLYPTHVFDFLKNTVHDRIIYNKYLREVESTHKDASFSERLKIVMDMV